MNHTTIEWTDFTINPVRGCQEVSPGCGNCYAKAFDTRFGRDFHHLEFFPERIAAMQRFRPKPKSTYRRGANLPPLVFVVDMSDLFQRRVPDVFIEEVLAAADANPHCEWQFLTKRPERAKQFRFPSNAWIGTSVESSAYRDRIDHLREIESAAVRFVSFEPLRGPVGPVDWTGIDWAIVGGESGPRHRSFDPAWARELRDQCLAAAG